MSADLLDVLPAEAHAALPPFALALARWVHERSGDAQVALAALAVAAAEQAGHGCALLDAAGVVRGMPGFPALDRTALRAHPWVGDGTAVEGSAPTPLVLDAAGRCYSWRSYSAERRIGEALRARCADRTTVRRAEIDADLARVFSEQDADASRGQREAIAAALGARVFVLSGGPGTGKTATVVRWLALLLRWRSAVGLPDAPVLRLAAPTGKAAQRLAESVRAGREQLAGALAGELAWGDVLSQLPDTATTLHRLLGFDPHRDSFRYNPARPLSADVVVVDEASMIDLSLMRALLDALRPEACLLLLGDPDQLASVAAGSVLGDIVAAAEADADAVAAPAANLGGRVVQPGLFDAPRQTATTTPPQPMSQHTLAAHCARLRHVFRAAGPLVAFAEALRQGDAARLLPMLGGDGDGADQPLRLSRVDSIDALRRRLRGWLEAPAQRAVQDLLRRPAVPPATALDALRSAQVLAALREGAFGVAGLNTWIDAWLRQRFGTAEGERWYAGRVVMVSRNDAALGLSNGDIGVALEAADGSLGVWFDGRDAEGASSPRRFAPRLLPEHVDAFALTIHKSQGSEYDAVVVVLPPDADSPILSRELLYTGVTRARRAVDLWGSSEALAAAAARPISRHGGLRERLRG